MLKLGRQMRQVTQAQLNMKPLSNNGLAWLQWLGLVLVFSIGLFGYLMQTVDWFHKTPGDLGDARFNSIVLEHLYQWTTGQARSLWSPEFFYPFEGALAFSDNHFGSGLSYIAARWFGFIREDSFLIWFLVGNILNFWVCWWVLKRMGFSVMAAALGAFVFAFALPVLLKENHAQLVYRFATPLAFAAFYRTVSRRSRLDLAKTGVWFSVQVLCSIYLGVFLAYLLLASLVAYGLCQPRLHNKIRQVNQNGQQQVKRDWLALLWYALAVLAIAVAVYVLNRYQQIANDYHFSRPIEELKSMLPRIGSYFLADGSQLTGWIGQFFREIPTRHEQQMFFGLGAWCLSLLALVTIWSSKLPNCVSVNILLLGRVVSVAWLILFVFTLSVNEHSIYLFVAELPGIGSIRAVSRIALTMLMPVAVLVALATDVLLQARSNNMVKTLVGLALIAGVSSETVYYNALHVDKQEWLDRQQRLSDSITNAIPAGDILWVTQDDDDPFFMTEIDAVIYAQDHHLRTLNGYSGNVPPGYSFPDPCVPASSRIDAYFVFRGADEVRRQEMLSQLGVVSSRPCLKP